MIGIILTVIIIIILLLLPLCYCLLAANFT